MGLINNPRYCLTVDHSNIEQPENVLGKINFFTDYNADGLARGLVMKKIGYDTMPDTVSKDMHKSEWNTVIFLTFLFYFQIRDLMKYLKMSQ